ncbi:MAG: Mannose-6-phosphate isomerase [uncultured Sphingomonadaceae bacterium]|uniref:Mannose-6-phosphate isomerase n=1 Tax=uncultured Sphingomonadaceae bacterium TaxID=169976 RepID=A0A6J4S4W5_9SPHN|nr:MAG: Mannose-6-phosphate isomerase [uncultured Sphingomonadaceae bacterium]
MTVTRLTTRRVEKVWGRRALWPGFDDPAPDAEPIGEIWFEDPRPGRGDPDLLIKYLFTAEKLSVQVHPDDRMAQSMGQPRGKDEAWVVLAAEPHATIGIGLRRVLTPDELRAAALDGSIEQLLDWRTVVPGDVFYSPSGTIHAIGPGVTLVEIQQNSDTTFRLYDYGRPRELHLEESIAAADPVPYVAPHVARELAPGRTLLGDGPKFVLERWTGARDAALPADAGPVWVVPLAGAAHAGDEALSPGGAWLIEDGGVLSLGADADVLIAYGGSDVLTL